MLDVHPPEHAAQTWRDFFIHIATIVVGLVIAVGLEQSVEYIHHRHQRAELQEALHEDTLKAIQDSANERDYMAVESQLLNTRIGQVQEALDKNHPLTAPLSTQKHRRFDIPDDPAWKAAKSSGLIELLPQNGIKVYSEVDSAVNDIREAFVPTYVAVDRLNQLSRRFMPTAGTTPDFSHASRQDLEEYRNALIALQISMMNVDRRCRAIHGAEVALLNGTRDLNSIQQAERNGW